MKEEKKVLTRAEALELVGPQREEIHCFRQSPLMLVGADWSWSEFLSLLNRAKGMQVAGPTARNMLHPLVVTDQQGETYFFESTLEAAE